MENKIIKERLSLLRTKMQERQVDYIIIPTSDYHNSEYPAEYFQELKYYCGFTGENGTLLVGMDYAGMWTDGRFFISAVSEMEGTGVELCKMMPGVPTLNEFLSENMKKGQCLSFDGRLFTAEFGKELENDLKDNEITIKYDEDIAGSIWADRPSLPCTKLYELPDDICGKSFDEKLAEVRSRMKKEKAASHLLTKLDDIMWLTNLRADDIECNPVAFSYAFITMDKFFLFVQRNALTPKVEEYLRQNRIEIKDYEDIFSFAKKESYGSSIMIDSANLNYYTYKIVQTRAIETGTVLLDKDNPTSLLKAVKNETELKNLREVYLKDSARLTEFIYWLKMNIGKEPMTEYSAAMKLDSMRSKLPGFIELSFPTISAYGSNAAMMHYEATKEKNSELKPEGMLLVDSGATYMGGTTDVTRTIVLGEISDEIRKHYTATLLGMLHLAGTVFMKGCYGRNLDIMAREPLWKMNMDYKCGTGHGVGYMLNVHEGPVNIRCSMRPGLEDAVLVPGMIVSDEPGVYVEGSHGIRIENVIEVVSRETNSDGEFLHFKHLTYVPVDPEAIDTKYMTAEDIEMLNEYNKDVYEKISPYIEKAEIKEWLKEQTKNI